MLLQFCEYINDARVRDIIFSFSAILAKQYGNISKIGDELMEFLNDIDGHFLIEQLFSAPFNENDATHSPLQTKMIWRPITEG